MAQVPFLFGALDEFSRRGLSQSMAFEQMAGASQGFLSQLQAANEADVAPQVDLPEMQGANFTQGLGAILQNIIDPGAAERFANQQSQVRQFNAQVQAQEALQNQVQEGYLQRRKQERQELMAKLQADSETVKARLDASLRELGIERDAQTAKARADAERRDREQDLLMNSKWLQEHGQTFHVELTQATLGKAVNPITGALEDMDVVQRELARGRLMTIALSAPPGPLRDKLMADIASLDKTEEERKRLENIARQPKIIEEAGQSKYSATSQFISDLNEEGWLDTFKAIGGLVDDLNGLVSTEPLTVGEQQGFMRAGSVMPEDADFLRRVNTVAPTDPMFLFNRREELPDIRNPKTPLGSSAKAFNELMENFWGLDASVREGRDKVIQAVKQESPTRR